MKKTTIFSLLQKLLEPTKQFSLLFVTVIWQAIIHGWIMIWFTYVVQRIIDITQMESWTWAWFENAVIVFVSLCCVHIVNQYIVNTYTLTKLWPIAHNVIVQSYMKKFFSLQSHYTELLGTGKLINVIERWAESWFHTLLEISRPLAVKWWRLLFAVVYIFLVDVRYGFVCLILCSVLLSMHVFAQNRANRARRKRKEIHMQMSRTLVRQIQSKNEIIQSRKIDYEVDQYTPYKFGIIRTLEDIMKYKFYGDTVSTLLIQWLRLCAIFAVWYGLFWWILNVSTFVVVMMLLSMIDGSLYEVSRLYISLTGHFTHIEKLREVFDNAPVVANTHSWKPFVYNKWTIKFAGLWFQYDDTKTIFDDFSLRIQWWTTTALVWHSWSGKSTLIKLLSGYLIPTTGSVSIDWQDLQTVQLDSLYQHIWYLTQEPAVFDGTIRENLLYGISSELLPPAPSKIEGESQDASSPILGEDWGGVTLGSNLSLHQAIKLSQCEFIYDLEQWLDTEIGERWVRLSWGQRQRLAIAKIFLKNPEIIILDEPTSALDSFSEEKVTEAMHTLFAWRTVIIIAHRLQTVREADDIIVLDQWKMVERWTHNQLDKQWWTYKRMLDLQTAF